MNDLLLELTREIIDLKMEKKKFDKEMVDKIKDVQKRIEDTVTREAVHEDH